MTRFVLLSALVLAVAAAASGKSIGMDALGITCLGFLSALGVLMLGGWLESIRLTRRRP